MKNIQSKFEETVVFFALFFISHGIYSFLKRNCSSPHPNKISYLFSFHIYVLLFCFLPVAFWMISSRIVVEFGRIILKNLYEGELVDF